MKLTPELAELLRTAKMSASEIIKIVQTGLQTGQITAPPHYAPQIFHAGGTNLCPNSDFAFSKKAATVANTLPSDVDADNQRVYRVFHQANGANISTNLVEATPAHSYDPIWDKVQGIIGIGSEDAAPAHDIAIQLTNNWLVGNRKYYVRIAVALDGDDPLPSGTKLYAGFWVKHTASEGWVTGDDFELGHKIIGTAGTREFNYKVLAKTDSGRTIQSTVLNITDIPDTLGPLGVDNKVRITYPGALGFIEFFVYRQDVSSGQVDLIAWDRNSSKLIAFDTGQSLKIEPSGFPTATSGSFRAYEEVTIDAVDIAVQKTFHDFVIKVPGNFDASDVLKEGTYLRFGVIGETTNDEQVLLDTVWFSESYNVWSPSPFDDYPSPPSTTMTTSYGSGGGGVGGPPTGGGTCIWVEHDLLTVDGWVLLKDAAVATNIPAGLQGYNTIEDFINGETSQYFKIEFDCGLDILCTATERFARDFGDNSGLLASQLKVGSTLQGGHKGEAKMLKVLRTSLINGQPIRVRSPKMTMSSTNRLFAIGDRETGYYVYCHNVKQIGGEGYPIDWYP